MRTKAINTKLALIIGIYLIVVGILGIKGILYATC